MHRKVETFSSEAKIVRIGAGSFKIFSKPTGKGDGWTILLCVGGKNRAADSNFGEKTASQSRSSETAVSSLDFVYRKLRQTPESPPPPPTPHPRKKTKQNDEIGQIDTSETRQGEFNYLILFKKVTFVRFYPSLF